MPPLTAWFDSPGAWRLAPVVAACALLAIVPRALPCQEFTQQRMLVANFETTERNLGRQVAHALRSQVRRGSNRRQLYVLETWEVDSALTRADYGWDETIPFPVLRLLGRERGTDEIVMGTAERRDGMIHAEAALVLTRDAQLIQRFQPATGRNPGDVANQIAEQVLEARKQMTHLRRCENAAREQQLARARDHAAEGARLFPTGTLVRTCLVRVLARRNSPEEVIREGLALLRLDSLNGYALEHVAEAYDQLRRRDDAARMWSRLAALGPDSTELVQRVVVALLDGGNPGAAEPIIAAASERQPENMSLLRLRWHAHFENDNWPAAMQAGERLLAVDALTQDDSTFHVRMVGIYRTMGRPLDAIGLAAPGVKRFPDDPRLYLLYTELVRAEAPLVLDRGLDRFPSSAELLALRARELRREGRVDEALHATRMAVEADPRLAQGYLQLAQAYTDAGMPDSAFAMLPRALEAGERSEQVAQYALSRGNAIYRESAGESDAERLTLAFRYLTLSDSLLPSREAKFLRGATGSILVRLSLEQANTERACSPVMHAADLLPVTMTSLEESADLAPEAAAQQLEYLSRLQHVVGAQMERYCPGVVRASGGAVSGP